MPITVKPLLDPAATLGIGGPNDYAEPASSRVTQRVAEDIEAYALGKIPGRSFLVAGHRGSGKTSAVNNAIRLANQALEKGTVKTLRIADIRLHGPDLFARAAAVPQQVVLSDTEQMLRQVTLALYRRTADVFTEWYQTRLFATQTDNPDECAELAAQFRLDLDGAPDVAALREYWTKAASVHSGVLYPKDSKRPHRGLDELVALACAAQAYQLVIGDLKITDVTASNAQQKRAAELKANRTDLKEGLASLGSLFAGSAAGAAAFSSTQSALAAAALGIVTAGVSFGAVGYSWSRSSEESRKREVTFLPDTSVESLDRVLPLLVERIRKCGIVPVFVVDELDKVDDLPNRIAELVRYLKHFVTERAFFCFLTERDFYEQLIQLSLDEPYPTQHTYFSDRLLMHFSPSQLHTYLSGALQIDTTEDQQAAEVLRYVLLHRSRSHPFDLRQKLSAFQDDSNRIKLTTSTIQNTRAYRFDVTIQLAVELVLGDQAIADRLASNPEFMLLACDALYYPSRTWAAGATDLDLTLATFSKYLCERLGIETFAGPEPKILLQAVGKLVDFLAAPTILQTEATKAQRFPTSAIDTVFTAKPLLSRTGERVSWNYDAFGRELAPPPAVQVVEAVTKPEAVPETPTPRAATASDEAPPATQSAAPPISIDPAACAADVAAIRRYATFVREATEDLFNLKALAVDYRLISITPTWDGAMIAMSRLDAYAKNGQQYPDFVQDAELVREYRRMLEARWRGILNALQLAAVLGIYSDATDRWSRLKAGLSLLARMARFEFDAASEVDERLAALARQAGIGRFADRLPTQALPRPAAGDPSGGPAFPEALSKLPALDAQQRTTKTIMARSELGDIWRSRFADALQGVTTFTVQWPDLVCKMVNDPVTEPLLLDLNEITIRMWSGLVLRAWKKEVPPWMAAPALAFLGFRDRLNAQPPVPLEEDDLREFRAWASPTSSSRAAVLVVLNDSSVLDGRPDGRACFASTQTALSSTGFDWEGWVISGLAISRLLAQIPEGLAVNRASDLDDAPWLPGTIGKTLQAIPICSEEQASEIRQELIVLQTRYVVAPKTLNEALAEISRPSAPPTSRATP